MDRQEITVNADSGCRTEVVLLVTGSKTSWVRVKDAFEERDVFMVGLQLAKEPVEWCSASSRRRRDVGEDAKLKSDGTSMCGK